MGNHHKSIFFTLSTQRNNNIYFQNEVSSVFIIELKLIYNKPIYKEHSQLLKFQAISYQGGLLSFSFVEPYSRASYDIS